MPISTRTSAANLKSLSKMGTAKSGHHAVAFIRHRLFARYSNRYVVVAKIIHPPPLSQFRHAPSLFFGRASCGSANKPRPLRRRQRQICGLGDSASDTIQHPATPDTTTTSKGPKGVYTADRIMALALANRMLP